MAANEQRRIATAWHAQPVEQVLGRLAVQPQGLATDEARSRLEQHGPNRLPPPKQRGPLIRLLAQFHNVLIYVLIAAAVMTALLGHWLDTAVIAGVVVINAIIGFVQEGKAERALDAIREMLALNAMVLRDGQRIAIPADEIVPGDVVLLQSGDKVPADLRLIEVKSLQVQEAALTGESVPVEKRVAPVDPDAALGDRGSMAFSGTLVTYGQARGVTVATGGDTELGRISAMIGEVETMTTPLLRQIAAFSRVLTVIILGLAALTFAFGILVRDYAASEMFLAAVGLAVAAIPEGLPAIMTITLAIGVQRMARRNAIIRRLPAVETLGAVTVICSDKTGTLTRNEMTVQTVAMGDALYTVTGAGYTPEGAFFEGETEVEIRERPLLDELARGALLCCDATLRRADGDWVVEGDPTEGALVALAMKAGLDPTFEGRANPRTDVIPFESAHRFMATLHHDHEGRAFIYVKGAPERLLEMCATQRSGDVDVPLDPDRWHERMEAISARGQRLLALATRTTVPDHRDLTFADVEDHLTLLGLFGLADPPREEAIRAVADCQSAGIRVKMITGDHAGTARAIGRELRLAHGEEVLTGRQLDTLDEEGLRRAVSRVDVFARTSPEHKLRLVQALQARGQVVAMTGDGVNDAPALKRADVGVAMGQKGTDAAKEAAEMVLADDNFASIASAVEEGRTVYDNIKKAITFILPTNGGQAMVIMAAIALGMVLPITPVQILWVNMVTAVTLALALAFEPPESDIMSRPPRPPEQPLFTGFLLWRIGFVSVLLWAGSFGLFVWAREQGSSLEEARTIAVNTLVTFEIFYLWNTRHLLAPILSREGLFGSRPVLIAIALVIVLQLLFTYAPPLQALFGTAPLGLDWWALIIGLGVPVLLVVELEKWLIRTHARPIAETARVEDRRSPSVSR
jgi:magnesium-transporting ATPase (P-type)